MIHKLKTIQPYFDEVWYRQKYFEVRKNDRNYKIGDSVLLQEYDPETNEYLGRSIYIDRIRYILTNPEFVKDGYCIFNWNCNFIRNYNGELCEVVHDNKNKEAKAE
jgi:hypothetical protein